MNVLAFIERLSGRRMTLLVFGGAVTSSLIFSTLVYPRIAGVLNSRIAEDGYDLLAFGLHRLGTLTYYPSETPTVMRGPAYPAFVAGILFLGEHLYPRSVQIAQALVHGVTAVLCFFISMALWNRRRASFVAASVCAVHPFLLWYTARIVTETLAVFLFTLFVTALFWYGQAPSTMRAAVAGVVGGLGALCKQTLLPLPLLTFLFLVLRKKNYRLRHGIVLMIGTLAVLGPWTMRNFCVTQKIIPVHTLMGYNFWAGDVLAEHYFEAPLNYMQLITIGRETRFAAGDTLSQARLHQAEQEGDFGMDERLFRESLDRYRDDPLFFVRKLILNGVMFWTISGSPTATIVTSFLQIVALIVAVGGATKAVKRYGVRSLAVLPLALMALYFLSHLPIYALARFGLVMVPTMLSYAVGTVREETSEGTPGYGS